MGRMDGDGAAVEIVDPRGRIAQLELEIQRLQRANDQLQGEWDKLNSKCLALHDARIVGRGYRNVTVYADGTVEVDRSFDDDSQPASRRAL